MYRVPVESSSIESIGYEKSVLEVSFRNGGLYQYYDVPEELLVMLMQAGSKGAFFNRHIRGRFASTRLKAPQAAPI